MPLHFIADHPVAQSMVRDALQQLARRGQSAPAPMRGLNLQSVQVQEPHAVYDLGADSIASGAGLEAARNSGMRYIVNASTGPLAAEVQTDGNLTPTTLSSINSGPFVAATTQALTAVASLAPVTAGSYEARLLRCSALAVMAIWLRSDRDGNDLIYPVSPAPGYLRTGTTYTPDAFFAVLRPHARAVADSRGPLTQG